MRKALIGVLVLVALVTVLAACTGPSGTVGPAGAGRSRGSCRSRRCGRSPPVLPALLGPPVPLGLLAPLQSRRRSLQPESCSICHKNVGTMHQASYDQLYQDGVIQVTDLKYSFAAPDKSTVSFKMTKDGAPFDARKAQGLSIYFTAYNGKKFQFEPYAASKSLAGKLAYDGNGGVTTSVTGTVDYAQVPGLIVVFGRNETIGTIPGTRVAQNKYPFATLLKTGAGVDYKSAANVAGCVKCHTDPYLKHGYIYGEVGKDPTTDFYTCKACHLDNGPGDHFEWQLALDNPKLAADFLSGKVKLTPEQEAQYAYNTSLMNDVHMSHSMEFPYPQSMASCVTCHEGKLDTVLADVNFTVATARAVTP